MSDPHDRGRPDRRWRSRGWSPGPGLLPVATGIVAQPRTRQGPHRRWTAPRQPARRQVIRGGYARPYAADRPARVDGVRLTIQVPAGIPPSREAALLAVASHCTVHNTASSPRHIHRTDQSAPVSRSPTLLITGTFPVYTRKVPVKRKLADGMGPRPGRSRQGQQGPGVSGWVSLLRLLR